MKFFVLATLLILTVACTTTPITTNEPARAISQSTCEDTVGSPVAAQVQEICRLVNRARAQEGLAPLMLEKSRNQAAQAHARDMESRDYFSHTSPDGREGGDRLRELGIQWRTWGENIAWGQMTPAQAFDGWMKSPGHRANILNRNFRRLGIGISHQHWVQTFTD